MKVTININELLKIGIPSIIAILSLIFNLYQFKINQKTSSYKIIDELRENNQNLKDEIRQIRYSDTFESKIMRHDSMYVTRENDKALYCSVCWDTNKKLIQLKEYDDYDHDLQCQIHCFRCIICDNRDHIRPEFTPHEFAELEDDDLPDFLK